MSDMPPPQFADLADIRLAYYEAGPRRGIPVVFCHGFPEIAYSWRHQLKALSDHGRWAAAPDQRGYGLTGGPAQVDAYDIESLTGDLIGLLDRLGADRAIWCGHDWGGAIVWEMALRHPERTAGVIGLNTPYTPRAPADPIDILRRRFGDDMYIVSFQEPGRADQILNRDVSRTLSYFYRRPLANAPASSGMTGRPEGAAGRASFSFLKALEAYDPSTDPRAPLLNEAEFEVFLQAFKATGFTGGVNWYRNMSRNWRLSAGRVDHVAAPALMIMAERDAVLPPSAADGMERYVPDLEKALAPATGHWTQQEAPELTNRVILSWLDRRFPLPPA